MATGKRKLPDIMGVCLEPSGLLSAVRYMCMSAALSPSSMHLVISGNVKSLSPS